MISRRSLLEKSGLLAVASAVRPSWMPRFVFRNQQTAPRGDVLVVVFARGGFDSLNMVIPYGDEGNYFNRRRSIAIPDPDSAAARKGVWLDGFFGLHPSLALPDEGGWKEWYDNGSLAVVHAMHMQDPTRSHFDAMDYMERGTPGEKSRNDGWLGRHLSTMSTANGSPFRAVGMGTMVQASLRGPVPAVALQSIADFHLQGRTEEIARFQQHLQQLYGGEGWLDVEGQATFDALELLEERLSGAAYVPANGARYLEQDGFHRGMMQIAQLVKADVGLEVACIDIGGWDTHANQVDAADPTRGNMANLMARMASGITALMTDLRDYWEGADPDPGVNVVVMSEFGRRAYENGGRGTDHGHGNAMYVLGSGVNGGAVYARPWPGLAEENLDRGDLAGTTEYRDILGELLQKRQGNPRIADVFPGHTFDFLGLARTRATTVPTPEPTQAPPTPVPTAPAEEHRIYIPFTEKG
jgi:uncharacterized protein (DUF1501 family)